jgi:phosphoglycolate phosphatase-like HAD superfamily hydrolase
MVPMPGLFDVLATLRPAWRLGMATNRGATVPQVMRRFGLDVWLDAAVGCLDVPRPKPAPDVILECLARLGVPASGGVYVGDAESDLIAGGGGQRAVRRRRQRRRVGARTTSASCGSCPPCWTT